MNIGFDKKCTTPGSNKKRIIILSIISILPALVLFFIITKYWVNIPFWDQWDFSTIFDKYYSQSLTFSDFMAQHNESRKFFPRLIVLGVGLLTGWNVRVEMCIVMIFACLISYNLFTLLKRIENLNILNRLTLLLMINLFLFSPVQWENWLWGIQMAMYIPTLMLTTGLVINTSNNSIRTKVICSTILSVVSTFSYANGMLVWFLLLPVNALFKKEHYKDKKKIKSDLFYIFLYVLVALFTIGFYFTNYQKPTHHPSFLVAFSKPVEAIAFFLLWNGTPFRPSGSPYAFILTFFVGGLIFSIFLLSIIYCIYKTCKSSSKLSLFYPWFILGSYSIINGIITTFGRLGLGVGGGAMSKYTTFSIFLPISIVVLVYLIYRFYIRDKKIIAKKFIVIQTVALLFFLILYGRAYEFSIKSMRSHNIRLGDGKLALQFYKIIPDNKKLKLLYPKPQRLLQRFSELTKNGLLDFRPIKPDILKYLERVSKNGNGSNGYFDECLLLAGSKLKVHGWARQATKETPANNVILVYTDKNGDCKPFAILRVGDKRSDVAEVFKSRVMLNCGFSDIIDISHLPGGNLQISAWTVDTKENIAYQLANTYSIRKL